MRWRGTGLVSWFCQEEEGRNAYLDESDDRHGLVHVVESLEKDVGSLAVHVAQRLGKLA
jgi:hypothetical protein